MKTVKKTMICLVVIVFVGFSDKIILNSDSPIYGKVIYELKDSLIIEDGLESKFIPKIDIKKVIYDSKHKLHGFRIGYSKGEIFVIRNKELIIKNYGLFLDNNDRVSTGADSRVTLSFGKSNYIVLFENSVVRVNSYAKIINHRK